MKKDYSVIRNYKKFKKEYPKFIVFIKCGKYYYTYDSDSMIMMYLYKSFREDMSFRIEKDRFRIVLDRLLDNHLNVVLAGSKIAREYYSEGEARYDKMRKLGKEYYKATICSVNEV